MSDGTHIEWTDATANVVNGCSVLSPGCTNCYAMRLAGTRLKHHPSRAGLTVESKAGPVWNGEVRFHEPALLQVLKWRRPRRIFWNAHGDLFHENVPDEWIDRCFAVMALTPHHTHQVLTKRPERMREYLVNTWRKDRIRKAIRDTPHDYRLRCADTNEHWPLPNVWLGVSVEDQQRADERIPILLDTPAAVRWLSCEPLLGPVELTRIQHPADRVQAAEVYGEGSDVAAFTGWTNALTGAAVLDETYQDGSRGNAHESPHIRASIDWVVVGGESGPGARPMHPHWARSLRDQCAAAGVPFLFKQWGDWAPVGRLQDPAGDTDETIAAETAMIDAMQTLQDGSEWINPRRLQLVDGGMFNWANECAQPPASAVVIKRRGKGIAGRLLDGVQHDGYPGPILGQSTTLAEKP